MTLAKRFLILLIIFALFANSKVYSSTAEQEIAESRLPGDTVVYKITYGPFRVGTMKCEFGSEYDQESGITTDRMWVDSNPAYKLALVDFHTRYVSYIDSLHRPVKFRSVEYDGADSVRSDYVFDYADSTITFTKQLFFDDKDKSIEPDSVFQDTFALLGPTYDVFSFTQILRTDDIKSIPSEFYSFFDITFGPVEFITHDETKSFDLPHTDEEVDGQFYTGQLLFKGVAGWTGFFRVWVAKPYPYYLLRADLKVFLGSIKIRIESIIPNQLAANEPGNATHP